ncbi:MAG: T9SS type A sorting domain-containing protein [Bacteroidetes bacterium]|nr:T9SS type A sorting domain-containing protein [Bacteroidota bacterium]
MKIARFSAFILIATILFGALSDAALANRQISKKKSAKSSAVRVPKKKSANISAARASKKKSAKSELTKQSSIKSRFSMPAPTEVPFFHLENEGKKHKTRQSRLEYIETLHRAAPNTDWRTMEAQNRDMLRAERTLRYRTAKSERVQGEAPLQKLADGKLTGYWLERGSANQAGSAATANMDTRTNTIVSRSASGNIWKGTLKGNDWVLTDDSARLNFRQRIPNGANGDRLLRWNGITVQFSDNWGVSWKNAEEIAGLKASRDAYAWGYIEDMKLTTDAVWLIAKEWNGNPWGAMSVLYRSTDKGRTFVKIFNTMKDLKLWTNGNDLQTGVFSSEGKLYAVKSTGTYTPMGSLPTATAEITGGFDDGKEFYLYGYDSGTLYKTSNGGASWTNQGKTPDGRLTFVSRSNHNLLTCGFVDCYRSTDGGKTWNKINGWGEYYGDVQNKLHADIMHVSSYFDEQKKEVILVCCHGGTYVSYDGLKTVKNLSMKNHNISQYYSTLTSFHDPDIIYAGSQDQGYQRSVLDTASNILDFQQVISGDYGHFVSSDSGRTFWMTYPGFLAYLPNPRTGGLSAWWDYTTKGQLWMAPMMADPDNPAAVFMCGGSSDGAGGYLYKIQSVNGTAQATRQDFNFGAAITGAAYSPRNTKTRYVITNKGLFFATLDGGKTWTQQSDSLPGGHYFYGNCIMPSLIKDGRVYLSGSGYSNPGVFVSEDNGKNWSPLTDGLPATLTYRLAATPDEQFIFAATEAGPFVYSAADKKWYDMTGMQPGGAPDQTYWSVEYVQPVNAVRFATYGRGVWDFEIADFTPKIEAKLSINSASLCEGVPVPFRAQPIHAGKYPTYVWKVNGKEMLRSKQRAVEIPGLRNGDKVTCEVASATNGKAAVSEAITMIMRPSTAIGVAVAVAGQAPATADKPMTFTAKPQGFTKNIEFVWIVNKTDTFRNVGAAFENPAAYPGDLVVCRMIPPAGECTVPTIAEAKIGIADFTIPTVAIDVPVSFVNITPYGESWNWDFGDGTRSTLKNPMKIYGSAGKYTVTLTVQPGNTKRIQTIEAAGGLIVPYFNDFEQNSGGFRSMAFESDINDKWEWGANVKGKKFFNGKNGVLNGEKSWITNIGRDEGAGSIYALETPPFSFADASGKYEISFNFRQMTGIGGGFNLMLSTDKGTTWQVLGKKGEPSWYNADSLWSLNYRPGFSYFGMENRAAKYDVSMFAGQSDVRFRFVNGASGDGEDGVILDDFRIVGAPTTLASPIETKISSKTEMLVSHGKVEFFSPNGKLMCSIENLSDNSLGNIDAKIDNEGTGASAFAGKTETADFFIDKTFDIRSMGAEPLSGHYIITLYFTAEEIAGWEKATGNNRASLAICRNMSQDVTIKQTNEIAYGTSQKRETVFGGDYAVTAEFNGLLSGGFGVNKPSTVGVSELEIASNNLFYPNPAVDEVTVNSKDAMAVELRDATGKTVLTSQLNNGGFSVRGLPAGMYTAVVKGVNGVVATGKFIKE